MLFTELINVGNLEIDGSSAPKDIIPHKRYPIRENIRCKQLTPEDSSIYRLNHPANEDENQYNLLKFYELNYKFVQVMLDKDGEWVNWASYLVIYFSAIKSVHQNSDLSIFVSYMFQLFAT
jgi:hypothetical protein